MHWYFRDENETAAEREEELKKIKEVEAEALAAALSCGRFVCPLPFAAICVHLTLFFFSTQDSVLWNLASQVARRPPLPARPGRIRFLFLYETSLRNPSKQKDRFG